MKLTTKLLIVLFVAISIARGDGKIDKPDPEDGFLKAEDPKSLREMIEQANMKMKPVRIPTLELALLKETLKKAPSVSSTLSENLTKALKESPTDTQVASVLGIGAAEAIADPNINVIDSHVAQITSVTNSRALSFQPDQEEIKSILKDKYSGSNLLNVYRENLKVESIQEEKDFKIGEGVEQWKALTLSVDNTVLVGRRPSSIVLYVGNNETYQDIGIVPFDVEPGSKMLIETFNLWDSNQERVRHLILVAVNQQLIWHELRDNEVAEFQRWNLLKEIDSMVHFSNDGTEILLISTVDAQGGNVQAELIEFNVPDDQFWVLQVFPLQNRSSSMTPLDLGRDFIVAFVQENAVLIFRHEIAQHSRGKFTLFKTIEAANVSTISAFRIGGHSYLAIGGDQPQILRYVNGDFVPQTILSQSFGFVEQFFPVTIRTHRDDLMLLVQHRLEMGTHSIAVVNALVWNGIAFETALSVPCNISADPNANGFTCMLDLERDEGLLGAEFIHIAKEQRLYILVPRHEVHSGLFRVKYSMVDAEDPVQKDMEQMKKSIELINHMLEYEENVKSEVEGVLACGINPKDDVTFDNLDTIESIETEYLEFDKNVILNSDVIDFIGSSWTQSDFLIDFDKLEAAVAENEERLRVIDNEINMIHSNNRHVRQPRDSEVHNIGKFSLNGQLQSASSRSSRESNQPTTESSQIFYFYSVPANGQLNPQTMRNEPQEHRRRSRQAVPIEESVIPELRVDNIELETLNGIPFDDLLFLENGQLIVPDKDIIFTDSVHIENLNMLNDGKINGVDFSHEVLAVDSPNPVQHMNFEHVVVRDLNVNLIEETPVDLSSLKSLDIPDEPLNLTAQNVIFNDDLKIETVNGIPWDEFVAKLIPKHLPSSIPQLHIDGDLVLIGDRSSINAQFLNDLPFPSGFVLRGGNETIITGKKTFLNELVTTAIDLEVGGTIDGIQPFNMITLNQNQTISGETTFRELEVMNKLEVNGTIAGRQLDDFLPNPTLNDVREIAAAASFNELLVEGDVIIEDTYNGENLEKTLSEVVYESIDGSDVVIKGPKVFQNLEVQGDIQVASNFINDRSLDDFVMNDRPQTVNIQTLIGQVFFSNLKLAGLFNGINATELERSCVRTYGDQFIETPIIIGSNHRVEARAIDVKNHLNQVPIGGYVFIDQPVNLKEAKFEDLRVDELFLDGDSYGPGVFSSMNVAEVATNYLSKSRKQKISVPVTIQSLTTNGTFSSKTINSMDFDVFLNYMRGIKNYKKAIASGAIPIKNLIVKGDLILNTLHGRIFNQILQNVIWLNRPNELALPITFLDDVVVNGPVTLEGSLNGKFFQAFVENWVSNTENPLIIHGGKLFEKDLIVEKTVQTEILNGILFEDLLTVDDVLEARFMNIIGSVQVENLNIGHSFNGESIRDFTEFYSFDAATETHVIRGNVQFNHPMVIDYLETPVLNNYNVSEWRANMIGLNESSVRVSSHKIFTSSMTMPEGFYASYINEIQTGFLDQVVLGNEEALITINGDLEFTNDVYAQLIAISGDLYTQFINGCDTTEWTRFGLMTNRKLELDGTLHIDGSALHADRLEFEVINEIPFKELITLKTNQNFDFPLKVSDLYAKNPLIVHETVNGVKIEAARANTVMRNVEHQIIIAKTSFSNFLRVYGAMTAKGKVNGKRIEDAVLLNASPTIASGVTFRSLEAPAVYTENLVSGVNLRKWYEDVLWSRGREQQTITGNWRFKNLRILDDVVGNGMINGVNIRDIEANLKHSIGEVEKLISNYSVQYHEMCNAISASANMSLHSVHILKHFELDFVISESAEIFSHFAFSTKAGGNFFLVNTNCTTNVYKWKKMEKSFKKLYEVETGVVYEWSLVNNAVGDTFVITSSRMEAGHTCTFGGLNVWKMNGDQMFHVTTIATETEVLHLHTSQVQPGRFFALDILDRVTHFDVFGQKKEFWQLPVEHLNYSFLPPEVTNDLTLFNGRKVYMLESKFKRRQVREWFPHPNLKSFDNLPPLGAKVDPKKFQDPQMIRSHMLPSIVGSPMLSSEERNHFMNKVKQVGESVQRSLKESFSKIPKLTIKSDHGERLVSTRPLKPTNLKKDRIKLTTETSPIAREEQTVKLQNLEVKSSGLKNTGATSEKIEASSDKIITTTEEVGTTTEEIETTTDKIDETTTEAAKPTKKASKKTSFMIKQPMDARAESKPADDAAKKEIFGTFMEKLKSLGESVQSVLNMRKELNTNESKKEDIEVGERQASTEVEAKSTESIEDLAESSTVPSTSADYIAKSTTETETSEIATTTEIKFSTTTAIKSSTTIEINSSTMFEFATDDEIVTTAGPQPDFSSKTPKLQLPSIPITPKIFFQTEASTQSQSVGSENFPDDLPKEFPDKFDMSLTESISTVPELSGKNLGETKENQVKAADKENENSSEVLEQNVPVEILSGSGVRETDNPFIPELGTGELIMMYVGPNNHKRPLYAVTRNRNSEIIGNNNIIEVYSDIFEGFIYQYIHCTDPSHLIALQFRDETLLAFLENRNEIVIFIYRGIEGFVNFKRIKLPGFAEHMTALSLPPKIAYKCDHHYLVVRMETDVLFYGVKIDGNCGMRNVKCDDLV